MARIASHLTVSACLTGGAVPPLARGGAAPPLELGAPGGDAEGAAATATLLAGGGGGRARHVNEELAKLERALRPAGEPRAPAAARAAPHAARPAMTRASVADELSRISQFLQTSSPWASPKGMRGSRRAQRSLSPRRLY